jgi:HK97 family phage prohead protease
MTETNLPVREAERAFSVDDLTIRSDGSGRIVEAYAAIFNTPAEIMDRDGHYREQLAGTSFDRTIQHKGTRFGVLFNHSRTVDGQPNPAATMPLAVPVEVRADERGVFTASRYLDNPLADQVLDAIKQGAIRAQSFGGKFMRSAREYPSGRGARALPLITRQEVAMREYGPAVFAAYEGAEILGTRSTSVLASTTGIVDSLFLRSLLAMSMEERLRWLQQFEGLTTLVTPESGGTEPAPSLSGTPNGLAETDDSTETVVSAHSAGRSDSALRAHIRAERNRLGM